MRILVLGAGAIGGHCGLHLAEAGGEVSVLVRERRAAQFARDGLVVASRGATIRRAVPHRLAGLVAAPVDLALLACKAYDLDSAVEAIAPAVGPETPSCRTCGRNGACRPPPGLAAPLLAAAHCGLQVHGARAPQRTAAQGA